MPVLILLNGFIQTTEANKGVSFWVWLIIIVVILVLLWLLLRSTRQAAPKDETRMRSVAPAPVPMESIAQPVPAAPPAADDLTIIEGIGPKIAQILNGAGITTFNQLASTEVSRLNEILDQANLAMVDPGSWPEQARLAAAGDRAGLAAMQEQLKGGR